MSDPVHAFFSQWDIYRLCIENNTLHHREVGDILRREWLGREEPFTFLDLACGDAVHQGCGKAAEERRAHGAVSLRPPPCGRYACG